MRPTRSAARAAGEALAFSYSGVPAALARGALAPEVAMTADAASAAAAVIAMAACLRLRYLDALNVSMDMPLKDSIVASRKKMCNTDQNFSGITRRQEGRSA
jgi:hypothetical protein